MKFTIHSAYEVKYFVKNPLQFAVYEGARSVSPLAKRRHACLALFDGIILKQSQSSPPASNIDLFSK